MNIQELAKQADAVHDDVVVTPFLRRFAQIIRNQALEDAAVCCDELKPTNHYYERYDSDWATGTLDCCEAIRAMKTEHP